jgi:hypothetical protein
MKQVRLAFFVAIGLIAAFNNLAFAQGGGTRSPISGTVVDPQGAPIPGASVQVKDENSGNTFDSVTNGQGNFTIPALPAGTYTVTVTLSGFKKSVLTKNVLQGGGQPLDVKVKLELGGLEEAITVEGGLSLIQTQSAAITQTVSVNQITTLPVPSRSALDFLTYSAGVQTPGGTQNSRASMVSGLDQSSINITIDGMSIQDNFLKTTDGFFARVSPRLDLVEEMTLTSAAGNADNSGMGATQISFTTRRGNNKYQGSVYEYLRRDTLNANSWFNNRDLPPDPKTGKAPRAKLKADTPGFRFSGPIRIPGLFDGRDKAHFFINYEVALSPQQLTRNRNLLSTQAQAGIFRYGNQSINLLQLAAANGQISTVDPTIAKLLGEIRSSTSQGGLAPHADPNMEILTYQIDADGTTKYPGVRLDFQLTPKHLLTLSGNQTLLLSTPDTTNGREPLFPGMPVTGVQDSKRFVVSGTLRSTLTPNLINELRVFGASGGATLFSTEINAGMWANQGGFHLNINGACCSTTTTGTGNQAANISNAASGTGLSSREASTRVAYDHMTWIKDAHSISFGVDFTETNVWLQNSTTVPTITFGLVTGETAAQNMFTVANFPGASTANLNAAQGLYSMLTGRVSSIVGNARLSPADDTYKYLGESRAEARLREFDFFIHDTWKARGDLTLNYGLRYALQLPFYPLNNSYATATLADVYGVSGVGNLFKPGVNGTAPRFVQYKKGEAASKTDWNNFAPSVGFAWRPTAGGFLAKILSQEPVIRGGFSMAYNRNGMSDFTNIFGGNPGILIDATRSSALGNLGATPLLYRDQSRLGPPSFQTTPAYPLADVITGDVSVFDPNLKVPYSQTWSLGVQRKVGEKMGVDLRYVGSRGRDLWSTVNYNESNIVENGFLNEFRLAQANLQANIRAGRGNSFAYFGAGSGTSPLPIYLAYLNGVGAANAGDASRYTGASWTSTNFTNALAINRPTPFTPAGTNATTGLDGDPGRRTNARNAGLAPNFFRANPDLLGGAFILQNDGFTSYNALELALRRQYSNGFYFETNYAFSKSYASNRYTLRKDPVSSLNTGDEGGVTHTAKLFGGIDLPVGKGRKFAGNANRFVDAIIGGWQVNFTAIAQSGRMIDFGDVRLKGMNKKEFSNAYKLRFDDAGRKIYMLPQDIIENTIKAFDTSATSATGYGTGGAPTGRYLAPAAGPDCMPLVDTAIYGTNFGYDGCGEGELVVTGPLFKTVNLGISKFFKVKGASRLEFRAQLINAFNWANFTPVGTASATAGNYEVTGLSDAPRIAEMVFRFTW